MLPLEVCHVIEGQIMRKQVPPEKTSSVLEFATKKPEARLESIIKGLQVLQYGQSEYLRSFGLSVDSSGPVKIQGRVLNPPTLLYGQGSRQPTVVSSLFLILPLSSALSRDVYDNATRPLISYLFINFFLIYIAEPS
jgi:hypothetical protein